MHPLMIVNGTKDPIRAGLSPAILRAKFPFREPVVTAIWRLVQEVKRLFRV